jgi:lysyl-tRNA synthetase class 2
MAGDAWWRPGRFAKRRPALEARARILTALRAFFAAEGFLEVETPCLQLCPATEPHIAALATTLSEPFQQSRRTLYLHTSPELAMKKLLAAGLPRIFQFAHVWRDGERSPLHHPEFTMLEWYRAGAGYERLMDDCARLLVAAADAAGVSRLRRGNRQCDPAAPPVHLTVAEAFQTYCGVDLLATLGDPGRLGRALGEAGVATSPADSWEDMFFRAMLERIEPHLGDNVPLILCEYPLSLAVLSRPLARDPRVAERFELYVCGVELANAFGELTDAAENQRRFESEMNLRERLYGSRYPLDTEFIAALESGLPDCAGIALGFDRLVMLATAAATIEDVLWAPVVGG